MGKIKTGVLLLGLLICFFAAASLLKPTSAQRQNEKANAREDAYRANNLGVALLEQFKYKGARCCFKPRFPPPPRSPAPPHQPGHRFFHRPRSPGRPTRVTSPCDC